MKSERLVFGQSTMTPEESDCDFAIEDRFRGAPACIDRSFPRRWHHLEGKSPKTSFA
jgi:hypothetical protein